MCLVRYPLVIWTCLLIIVRSELSTQDEEGVLFYSVGSSIQKYYLGRRREAPFVNHPGSRIVGVATSAQLDNVYWSNITVDKKMILRTSGISSKHDVIADTGSPTPNPECAATGPIVVPRVFPGLVAPQELAVDWVTGNVYFIDNHKKQLGVCTEDGSYCTIILNSWMDRPGGLVLNPKNGEMFWTNHGEISLIARADMDGRGARPFVSEGLGRPKGLAIDYSKERLYWIDWKFDVVESTSLDGTDRQIFARTPEKQLHSIAIFNETFYWTDWERNTIESMDIETNEHREILVNASKLIYDIEIYHSSLKPPLPNHCRDKKCSEICLLAANRNYTCDCRFGSSLNSDLHTCSPNSKAAHLAIAAGDRIILYDEVLLGQAGITETLMPIKMKQIAYNRNTGDLIADDAFTNSLYSFDLGSNEIQRLTAVNSHFLGDLDFDYKNNIISWSDIQLRQIGRFRPNYGKQWHNNFSHIPCNVLSIPGHIHSLGIFVSHKLNKMSLQWLNLEDPSTSKIIIPNLPLSVISLAHDESFETLYFTDADRGNIESLSLKHIRNRSDSFDRKTVCSNVGKPISLAVSNGKVFWVNLDSNILNWVNLKDKYHRIHKAVLSDEADLVISDLVVVEHDV